MEADVGGRWIDPSPESLYHGRTNSDGGPAWVYPRMHSRAGLFVEVHHLSPDGPLLRRTAVTHRAEATGLVQRIRASITNRGVDAVAWEVAAPVVRGRLVLHGGTGRHSRDAALLDDGPATELCAVFWAVPGVHRIRGGTVSTITDEPLAHRLQRVSLIVEEVTLEASDTVERWLSPLQQRWSSKRPRLHWPCSRTAG